MGLVSPMDGRWTCKFFRGREPFDRPPETEAHIQIALPWQAQTQKSAPARNQRKAIIGGLATIESGMASRVQGGEQVAYM